AERLAGMRAPWGGGDRAVAQCEAWRARGEALGVGGECHFHVDVSVGRAKAPAEPDLQQDADEARARRDFVARMKGRKQLQEMRAKPHRYKQYSRRRRRARMKLNPRGATAG